MDKRLAGLLGAAAALTTVTAAQAATPADPNQLPAASSYQDLLDPIPNPVAALRADDARLAQTLTNDVGGIRMAQNYHHHHHHHHHVVPKPLRRVLGHHHHHHH